jgi:hypothetical protein
MGAAVSEVKRKLYNLKKDVRDQQKELEKSLDAKKTLSDTSSYCRVCELDMRTDPKEHEANNKLHNVSFFSIVSSLLLSLYPIEYATQNQVCLHIFF